MTFPLPDKVKKFIRNLREDPSSLMSLDRIDTIRLQLFRESRPNERSDHGEWVTIPTSPGEPAQIFIARLVGEVHRMQIGPYGDQENLPDNYVSMLL